MESNSTLVSSRIREYLINKVKETFPEDYPLIENQLVLLAEKYSLKELIIIVRIEIDRMKREDRHPLLD